MLEQKIKDYLISNVENLTASNCFIGNIPNTATAETNTVITSEISPLSDSHNSLAMKLSTPKGINEKLVALSINAQSDVYDSASNMIWSIYDALGNDDGGCIVQDDKQMFIIPVEAPYSVREITDKNIFQLNFIVRTQS